MTKKSLFLTLSFTLALVFLLTACQKTQTAPMEQNQNPPALSQTEKTENTDTAPALSDLPTANDTVSTQLPATDKTPVSDTGTAKFITREEAKEKALTHAGLTDVTLRRIETDLDRERGVTVYEVDFEHDGYDYAYVLNAETGEILFHEKELDWD